MSRYRRLYIGWFAVAIISGAALVKFSYGELGSGNVAAWPWALGSFIMFAVSVPCTIYYRGRKATWSQAEKEQQALEKAKKEVMKNGEK